jgi:uncharacterized protein
MRRALGTLALAGLAATALTATAEESRMTTVYLVLLKKGPARSAEQTDETRKIQEEHMANIRAMWAAKKLVVAGPLGDDGDIRGIFVFQVGSLEEAKALAASDPAVKAGRLVAEIHPWWVEKRALPPAGSYCEGVAP